MAKFDALYVLIYNKSNQWQKTSDNCKGKQMPKYIFYNEFRIKLG